MRWDVVLFDFDGTIADTGEGILNSARYALREMGVPVPDDSVLRRFVGPPISTAFEEYCHLSPEEADRAVEIYRSRYRRQGIREACIYPGLAPLMRALKEEGCFVGVASGKPQAFLEEMLKDFGLIGYVDKVAGILSETRDADKQSQMLRALPDGWRSLRCCMVGDRVFDVDSAKKLGMYAIAVGFGYGSREELEHAGADELCPTVADLASALLESRRLPRGSMISFEGRDGCGKSTQMEMLAKWLSRRGYEVVTTREPGGCPIAEGIREIILSLKSKGMTAECEALLYAAARIEHVNEVIEPALAAGKMVLCDRYYDSSFAYQGYGRELGEAYVRLINEKALKRVTPDRTLWFVLDRGEEKRRMSGGAPLDRMETERDEFFERIARGFERAYELAPNRIRRIDASGSVEEVFQEVLSVIEGDLTVSGR